MKTAKKNRKGQKVASGFRFRLAAPVLAILFSALVLSGCSDAVEVQNRDFVLALGVAVKEDKYELTFGLPDLSVLTQNGKDGEDESSDGQIRVYKSSSFAEIEDLYNHGSNKRLDYRHLDALILDPSISRSPDKLRGLFEYMDNHYQISRDVRVFYYPDGAKELIEKKGKMKGGIGDYLEKLEKNNQRKNGLPPVTLGNLIDSFAQQKDILIPVIALKEDKLEVEGAAIFQDSIFRKSLTDDELKIYYVIKGQGKEFNFHTPNGRVFKLKDFSAKTKYRLQDHKPVIDLSISGTAQNLSENQNDTDLAREINEYLILAIGGQINTCFKTEQLDYLNLYHESSLKNRNIWISYQNKISDFIHDTDITLDIDIEIQ